MGKLSRQLTLDRGQQAELRTILKEREQAIRTFRRTLLIQTNRVDRLPVGADGREEQIERHVRDVQTAINTQLQLLADSRERIYAMLTDKQRTRLNVIRRSGLYTGPVSHWP